MAEVGILVTVVSAVIVSIAQIVIVNAVPRASRTPYFAPVGARRTYNTLAICLVRSTRSEYT